MELADKITAVGKMQAYIVAHLDEKITIADVSRAAGYSKYYAIRVFKELTHKTPFETIRALRLTKAAQSLCDSGDKVVDVALESGFDSHDGFTRAFARQFGITPQKYQQEMPPVYWFTHYPLVAYYRMKEGNETMPQGPIAQTMAVTAVERPRRKLILLRSVKANDYLSYCEEKGCEWEGLFNSIPEKFDYAALLTLPPGLIKDGTGEMASGVEVPFDYNKPIPAGCDEVILQPCTMLYFQGAPFINEDDFGEAITALWDAIASYNPTSDGWQYDPVQAPYFNFGATAKTGARMARPVRKN